MFDEIQKDIRIRRIILRVLSHLGWRSLCDEPIKGYNKSTTFNGRGGAWFMIGICLLCIGVFVYGLINDAIDCDGMLWLWVFLGFVYLYVLLLLRYSILMLRAEIRVGPKGLVLVGAEEVPDRTTWIHLLKRELLLIKLLPTAVEIPWDDILCIKIKNGFSRLEVETEDFKHYQMDISYFDTKLPREISKYFEVEDVNT